MHDLDVRVEATDQVTSATPVEEGDVFVHYGLVEVFAEVTGDAFTQDVEDGGTEADTDT